MARSDDHLKLLEETLDRNRAHGFVSELIQEAAGPWEGSTLEDLTERWGTRLFNMMQASQRRAQNRSLRTQELIEDDRLTGNRCAECGAYLHYQGHKYTCPQDHG